MAFIPVQQIRIGVTDQRADHEDRADIEQQDAPEHGLDGFRHVAGGVGGFRGGEADAFGPLEGETGDQEDGQHGAHAADERGMGAGLGIAQGPVVETRSMSAEHADDHQTADRDEDDHGHHLDAREPVFGLGIGPDRHQVQRHQHRQKSHGPERRIRMREPELHDERAGHEFGREGDAPAEPVVPAEGETQGRVDEAFGVGLEGAGDGQLGRHLAERLHHAVHGESHDGVREQSAARSGLCDGAAAGEEQAGADRATDRNHAELAGADAAMERVCVAWGHAAFVLG